AAGNRLMTPACWSASSGRPTSTKPTSSAPASRERGGSKWESSGDDAGESPARGRSRNRFTVGCSANVAIARDSLPDRCRYIYRVKKKSPGRAGGGDGEQPTQLHERVAADGFLQILLGLRPARRRLPQLLPTCRGQADEAMPAILPLSNLHPSPLADQAQHPRQRCRIQRQQLRQLALGNFIRETQRHQQRELRDPDAGGAQRLVIESCHRASGAT